MGNRMSFSSFLGPEWEPEHRIVTCSICTDPVPMWSSHTRPVASIQCENPKHTCHDECLQRWVQVRQTALEARVRRGDIPEGRLCATCPTCREPLPNTDLVVIQPARMIEEGGSENHEVMRWMQNIVHNIQGGMPYNIVLAYAIGSVPEPSHDMRIQDLVDRMWDRFRETREEDEDEGEGEEWSEEED